jgi:hypothetical protein
MSTVGGNMSEGNYVPTFPPERAFYEGLWKYVNPSGAETLSGQDAVPFFQKSEVDNGILRQATPALLLLLPFLTPCE